MPYLLAVTADELGVYLMVATTLVSVVWWMSSLYLRVDSIAKQIKRMSAHMLSEFGGRDEEGNPIEGTQARARKEIKAQLNLRIDMLERRVEQIERELS